MIIAKNDEAKRSKIWRRVVLISSILIVVTAIFLLTKLFTTNPLEGVWADEDGRLNLDIRSNGLMVVTVLELAEDGSASIDMRYTIDRDDKIITITGDEEKIRGLAEKTGEQYTEEELRNMLASISTTFDYSVDQRRLTLSEREYGVQLIFLKV